MIRKAPSRRHIIDPVAFFAALVGGPVLFTLATFWVALVPVFALMIGGLPYLVIGTPALLIYLSRNPVDISALALLGCACVVVPGFIAIGAALVLGAPELSSGLLFLVTYGGIFAIFWAASFGWLYRRLAREFFTRPVPIS